MHKNGRFFVSVINEEQFVSSVWDPYAYRHTGEFQVLSQFVTIKKIAVKSVAGDCLPFEPVEYRDIPRGAYLSFTLRSSDQRGLRLPTVGEGEVLFGTMRAYLGNIIVTPFATWLGQSAPVFFQVKSEFLLISPHDGLRYFWMAYLRSRQFLSRLPLGNGGTRPRLQAEDLGRTPVTVPELSVRENINSELNKLAKDEWTTYFRSALVKALLEEGLDIPLHDHASAGGNNPRTN